jgi:hypothetical protein
MVSILRQKVSIFLFPFLALSHLLAIHAFAAGGEIYWRSQSSLSLTYDDNIFLTNENKVDDIITLISETIRIGIRSEDFDAGIDVSIGYACYEENDQNNGLRWNINFANFKDYPLAENVFLDLDGYLSLSEEPIELDELYASDRNRSRNQYFRSRAGATIRYEFGEEEDLSLGYRNILLENDDPTIEDSREDRPFFGLNYWFDYHHGFSVNAAYAKAEFDVSSDYDDYVTSASYIWRLKEITRTNLSYARTEKNFDDEGDDDYRFQNMTVGLSHQFDDSFSASVNAGLYRRNFVIKNDESGLSWSATLTKEIEDYVFTVNGGYYQQNPDTFRVDPEFSGSIQMSGQYEYSSFSISGRTVIREQLFEAENLGFNREETLSGRYSLQPLEDLGISISALYRKNKYLETVIPRTDKVWQLGPSLSYRIFERLTAGFSINHRNRDSTVPNESYEDNRVFFSLSYSFDGKPIEF